MASTEEEEEQQK
ncbi:hypothetical protein Pcinc_031045, partial [Petrolisthes cinctipes]